MNENSDNTSIDFKELSLILDDLKENGKLTGVILANRNGEKIDEKIEDGLRRSRTYTQYRRQEYRQGAG